MALDPIYFPITKELDIHEGNRVFVNLKRFERYGEGVIELIFLSLDVECVKIKLDSGGIVAAYPEFGDTVTRIY